MKDRHAGADHGRRQEGGRGCLQIAAGRLIRLGHHPFDCRVEYLRIAQTGRIRRRRRDQTANEARQTRRRSRQLAVDNRQNLSGRLRVHPQGRMDLSIQLHRQLTHFRGHRRGRRRRSADERRFVLPNRSGEARIRPLNRRQGLAQIQRRRRLTGDGGIVSVGVEVNVGRGRREQLRDQCLGDLERRRESQRRIRAGAQRSRTEALKSEFMELVRLPTPEPVN